MFETTKLGLTVPISTDKVPQGEVVAMPRDVEIVEEPAPLTVKVLVAIILPIVKVPEIKASP